MSGLKKILKENKKLILIPFITLFCLCVLLFILAFTDTITPFRYAVW